MNIIYLTLSIFLIVSCNVWGSKITSIWDTVAILAVIAIAFVCKIYYICIKKSKKENNMASKLKIKKSTKLGQKGPQPPTLNPDPKTAPKKPVR